MGYSKKIVVAQRTKSNGVAELCLRIIIDRKKKDIPLNIDWPPDKFDVKAGVCKPRSQKDDEVDDINIQLGNALTRANEIFKHYRLTDKKLELKQFIEEWTNQKSR